MNEKGYYVSPVDYQPLPRSVELRLFRQVHKRRPGWHTAEQKLLGAYLLFAAKIGRQTSAGCPDLDDVDIISVSNDALLRAVRNFNPNRGVRFSTYSARFMRGAVMQLRRKTLTRRNRETSYSMQTIGGLDPVPEELRVHPHQKCEADERLATFTRILDNSAKQLTEQEQQILKLMRKHQMNMSTVARIKRCSRERVRQLYAGILVKLRSEFKAIGVEEL